MSTDRDWIQWGERDPYFAVLTQPKYRADQLDERSRLEFFAEGHQHVDSMLALLRTQFGANFAPREVLDFGCGVGRVVVPLSELDGVTRVVGVDISPAMLEETRRNCRSEHAHKLELVLSDDALSKVNGQFDLVHSCIVLQHIPAQRGVAVFTRLIDLIKPNGMGVVHVVYGKSAHADRLGRESAWRSFVVRAFARWRTRILQLRRRIGLPSPEHIDPVMEMNCYSLNDLAFLLQASGVRTVFSEFTDHGGALGVILYFQRAPDGAHA